LQEVFEFGASWKRDERDRFSELTYHATKRNSESFSSINSSYELTSSDPAAWSPAVAGSDSTQVDMRYLSNIGLTSWGLLLALLLPPASASKQRVDQLIVEKERFIPAGPGQKPFDVTRHVIRLDEIQAGGPPKNGIPALDHPAFVSASEADRSLKAQEIILGVEFSGVAKAYPVRILNWHEVVNDDVGEQPILISWCPLCGSGLAYDPRADGGHRYTFGVSGLLYQQNLMFFDHETESLWSQLRGGAVAGPLAGKFLRLLPVPMTTWQSWKAEHPQTLVLSFQTGYKRDYSRDRRLPEIPARAAGPVFGHLPRLAAHVAELADEASSLDCGHTFRSGGGRRNNGFSVQPECAGGASRGWNGNRDES
jgi:hypothetical protein